jgi:hypothetical protein
MNHPSPYASLRPNCSTSKLDKVISRNITHPPQREAPAVVFSEQAGGHLSALALAVRMLSLPRVFSIASASAGG